MARSRISWLLGAMVSLQLAPVRFVHCGYSFPDHLDVPSIAARGVATANDDPLLPLLEASIHYLESIGQAPSQVLNRLPADRTHLNVGGQYLFGRMVADLMRLFVPFEDRYGISEPFVVDAPLSEAIWTGKQYVYTVSRAHAEVGVSGVC
jgi:hypothetical protein